MNKTNGRTLVEIKGDTKLILDEINESSKIPYIHITDKALRRGLKILFRKHLTEETITKLKAAN